MGPDGRASGRPPAPPQGGWVGKKGIGVVQAANNQVMAGILKVFLVSEGNAAIPRTFYLPYGKDDRSADLRSYDI
jgi:hypothetical protein